MFKILIFENFFRDLTLCSTFSINRRMRDLSPRIYWPAFSDLEWPDGPWRWRWSSGSGICLTGIWWPGFGISKQYGDGIRDLRDWAKIWIGIMERGPSLIFIKEKGMWIATWVGWVLESSREISLYGPRKSLNALRRRFGDSVTMQTADYCF